jgi:beta-lactamase regulating signal transducer with metallopeptidase domain/biopolymer transport protein ExbD
MSIATVLWILAVSGLVFGVAGATAAALRHLGRPERGVWAVALVVTASLPFLPAPVETPAGTAASTAIPIAQVMSLVSTSLPAPTRVSIPWIPLLWALGSASTLVAMLGGGWMLSRRRESWPRRRVEGDLLRISDDFGPAVVGWVDAEIVLPAWVLDMEARQRRLILRHEQEHRWARDPLLLAFGVVCLATAVWNPLAWLQFRGLRRAIEFDCDARVLDSGASPRAYGRLLLSVQLDAGRTHLFAPALREPASFLERRLHTMTLRHRPVARLRVAGLTLIAASLAVVACETPRPTEAAPESAEATFVDAPVAAGVLEEIEVPPLVEDGKMVVFTVLNDGVLEVRRRGISQKITRSQVAGVWRGLAEDGAEFAHIRVDGGTSSGSVAGVLEALQGAGADKISVQTWGSEAEVRERIDDFGVPTVREEPEAIDTVVATGSFAPQEGARGTLRIRGTTSIDGRTLSLRGVPSTDAGDRTATPLIVVDGVRVEEGPDLSEISPADIERVEVVKGSAAREIWGEDGANGVIKIFTRKN